MCREEWREHKRACVVALLLLLGLTGCVEPVDEPRDPPTTVGEQNAEGTSSLGGAAKLIAVDYNRPAGFVESDDFALLKPLYPNGTTQWMVPEDSEGIGDVIAVTAYPPTGTAATGELEELVDGFAEQVDAISASDPVRSTVAGYPALTQSIEQPDGESGSVTYDTTYVFAGTYLVQVLCQYDDEREVILAGCADVQASLKLRFEP
jgi:hypothetical protein